MNELAILIGGVLGWMLKVAIGTLVVLYVLRAMEVAI
jgi:hypothetical protein